MRADGEVTYFFIQHETRPRNSKYTEWVESALDQFLFHDLSYSDRRGDLGDHYRALMDPQSASSDLWQKYGIHGYVNRADACAILKALNDKGLDRRFRIVRRTVIQKTEVVQT